MCLHHSQSGGSVIKSKYRFVFSYKVCIFGIRKCSTRKSMNAPLEQRWRISIHRTERNNQMKQNASNLFSLFFHFFFYFLFFHKIVYYYRLMSFRSTLNYDYSLIQSLMHTAWIRITFLLLLLSIKMGNRWLFRKWYTQSRCISLRIGRFWRRLISQCNLIINRTTYQRSKIEIRNFEWNFNS